MHPKLGFLLGLAVVTLFSTLAQAAVVWPTDAQWTAVLNGGSNYTDVTNDIVNVTAAANPMPAQLNIVGDAANPAGFWFQDLTNIYLRMRVEDDPLGPQGFSNFVWQVYFNTDLDAATEIDWVLQLDSSGDDQVELVEVSNVNPINPTTWYSNAVNQLPAPHTVFESITDYARAEAVNAFFGSTTFGGSPNWFVDIAFPLAKFNSTTGLANGIAGSEIYFATSGNHTNSNKDAPDFAGSSIATVPEPTSALCLLGIWGSLLGWHGWTNRRRKQG